VPSSKPVTTISRSCPYVGRCLLLSLQL